LRKSHNFIRKNKEQIAMNQENNGCRVMLKKLSIPYDTLQCIDWEGLTFEEMVFF